MHHRRGLRLAGDVPSVPGAAPPAPPPPAAAAAPASVSPTPACRTRADSYVCFPGCQNNASCYSYTGTTCQPIHDVFLGLPEDGRRDGRPVLDDVQHDVEPVRRRRRRRRLQRLHHRRRGVLQVLHHRRRLRHQQRRTGQLLRPDHGHGWRHAEHLLPRVHAVLGLRALLGRLLPVHLQELARLHLRRHGWCHRRPLHDRHRLHRRRRDVPRTGGARSRARRSTDTSCGTNDANGQKNSCVFDTTAGQYMCQPGCLLATDCLPFAGTTCTSVAGGMKACSL